MVRVSSSGVAARYSRHRALGFCVCVGGGGGPCVWVRGKEGQTSASGCVVTQVPSTSLFFLQLCFLFVAVCLMHACGCMRATACMRRPENNAQELVVSPL